MTFLSSSMLFGLALLGVPLLLHLLNKGRSHTVPWGAMDFLMRSIAVRNRRVRFEEALLLAARCLLLALLVMAMARPFLPSRGNISWVIMALMFALAAVCAGIAGAFWDRKKIRHILLAATACLLLFGVSGGFIERRLQDRWWNFAGGTRDIAVIIDGSAAMALPYDDEHTFFDAAVNEARLMAENLRPGDAISLHVVADAPVALLARPTSDANEIKAAFESERLAPPGGRLAVPDALNAAITSLSHGNQPHKTILVFSVGNRSGWAPENKAQWDFLVDRMDDRFMERPELLYRRLRQADAREIRNLAVAPPEFSRRLIDTARPIRVQAEIVNTGTVPLAPQQVNLSINGKEVNQRTVAAEIAPGASETIFFNHHFSSPGPHVVEFAIETDDDIESDNRAVRIAHVEHLLPILVIDGAPATRRLRSASAFVNAALAPAQDDRGRILQRIRAISRGEQEGEAPIDAPAREDINLVQPEIISVSDVSRIGDLGKYRAVILLNVPRLPDVFATQLADYVNEGNGLWIVPGHQSRPEHFERWRSRAGEPLWPAKPTERIVAEDRPIEAQTRGFSHPALRLFAADRHSDAELLRINSYWRLIPDARDPNIRVAGALMNGDPFMYERSFGKGSVMLSSFMLDREDSNLPALKSFVPLVHEIVYYLAGARTPNDNAEPGSTLNTTIRFAPGFSLPELTADGFESPTLLPVTTPAGRSTDAELRISNEALQIIYRDTMEAGLYSMDIPSELAAMSVSNRLAGNSLSFAVTRDPRAALIVPFTETDELNINEYTKFHFADSAEDLSMILAQTVPGRSLWTWFALAALALVLGELAVSRYITMQRRRHTTGTIDFEAGTYDNTALRSKVKQWFPNRQAT